MDRKVIIIGLGLILSLCILSFYLGINKGTEQAAEKYQTEFDDFKHNFYYDYGRRVSSWVNWTEVGLLYNNSDFHFSIVEKGLEKEFFIIGYRDYDILMSKYEVVIDLRDNTGGLELYNFTCSNEIYKKEGHNGNFSSCSQRYKFSLEEDTD